MTVNKDLRLPAEWEPVSAVMMAWPHGATDWAHMLDEVRQCYLNIIREVSKRARVLLIGPEHPAEFLDGTIVDNVYKVEVPTNDTWTRDYGPVTMVDSSGNPTLLDFTFNGWGLKFAADKDNYATRRLFEQKVFSGRYANRLGFVLEGGGIECDGRGTLMTTSQCLLSPNRNAEMSKEEIEAYLKETFNVDRVLWLDHGALEGDDTDSHIDTLARFAPPGDVIFFSGCIEPYDSHFEELKAMREELEKLRTPEGHPYHLMELPIPDPVYDPDDKIRIPATYANFLFVNGAVLFPTYGQPMKDLIARQMLEAALPDYDIVPIDCSALIRQHGSLHCATMQLPLNVFN